MTSLHRMAVAEDDVVNYIVSKLFEAICTNIPLHFFGEMSL